MASTTASSARKAILRKPSVRSLYDKQDIWAVPEQCRSLKQVLIGYDSVSQGRSLRSPVKFLQNEVSLPLLSEHFLIRAIHNYSTDWASPFTRHVYETEATSVRLNMVYLHLWLLKFHLGRCNPPLDDQDELPAAQSQATMEKSHEKVTECPFKFNFFSAGRSRSLQSQMTIAQQSSIHLDSVERLSDRLIRKEHVRVYTDTFDDNIYTELRRQYRVIDHSLSAIFKYSPRALSGECRLVDRLDDDDLEELILYNILNEEPEAKREQIKRISDYIRISVHEEDLSSYNSRVESYFFAANADSVFKPYLSEQDKRRLEMMIAQAAAETPEQNTDDV